MKAAKVLSKAAMVTGCLSGIGLKVPIYLRRTGWDVYPTARSEADLKEHRSNGFDALYLDLNYSDFINSCILSLLQKCKYGVGALINNAGIFILRLVRTFRVQAQGSSLRLMSSACKS